MRGFDKSASVLAAIEAARVTLLYPPPGGRIALVACAWKSNILNDRLQKALPGAVTPQPFP